MRDGATRPVVCPTCGGSQISAAYRAEDVVYITCQECAAAWAVQVRTLAPTPVSRPERQKKRHRPVDDDFDDDGGSRVD